MQLFTQPSIADTIDVHLALWYVVLVCHQYVCKKYVDSVYVGGYGGPELCPVSFLVAGEGPSVLL